MPLPIKWGSRDFIDSFGTKCPYIEAEYVESDEKKAW